MKQVAMSKFHSVFVSHNGQAYSCGHGLGGRYNFFFVKKKKITSLILSLLKGLEKVPNFRH